MIYNTTLGRGNTTCMVRVEKMAIFFTAQVFASIFTSFLVPVGFFVLLVPAGAAAWMTGQVISMIVMSPILCGLFSPLLIPIPVHSAWTKGWIRPYILKDSHPKSILMPGRAIRRNVLLGSASGFLILPVALPLLAAFANVGILAFGVAFYVSMITSILIPPSLFMFCSKENIDHMHLHMTDRNIFRKVLHCFKM